MLNVEPVLVCLNFLNSARPGFKLQAVGQARPGRARLGQARPGQSHGLITALAWLEIQWQARAVGSGCGSWMKIFGCGGRVGRAIVFYFFFFG